MRQVKLCASGMPTAARNEAARLGEALGARYSECMRASTTHLLVPTQSGEKFARAAEFGVVSRCVFCLSFFGLFFFLVSREKSRRKNSLSLFF